MIVYYRLCDKKLSASNPPPYEVTPFEIAKVCLRSFVKAFEGLDLSIVFICDHCPVKYDKMIKDTVPFEKEIHHTSIGINETCLMQYDLYDESDEEEVLFAEYDYLWTPDTWTGFMRALRKFPFISPYDHPDKYNTEEIPVTVSTGLRYWKRTISTTATFATSRYYFDKHKETLYAHGYIDHKRWVEIEDPLFTPLPAIATHLARDFMAPHVNWEVLWKKYQ